MKDILPLNLVINHEYRRKHHKRALNVIISLLVMSP